MKKGIVLAIRADGMAELMLAGGAFVRVRAQAGWREGDVVSYAPARRALPLRRLVAVAACLLVLFTGAFGTFHYVRADAAVISIDAKPGIELTVGRNGLVKAVRVFGAKEEMLETGDLVGMRYEAAIRRVLADGVIAPYLRDGGLVEVSVYATGLDEAEALQAIEETLQGAQEAYPRMQSHCRRVDEETVAQAQAHHMSPNQYLAYLELREVDPSVEAETMSGCGVGEIRGQIRRRQRQGQGNGHHGNGHGR